MAPFWTRVDDTGIVHDSQLKTAIDCMVQLLNNQEQRCGHVLGAMQSGKTTTSLALQWAGPVLYLLRGIQAYPFYIIGNQTNHEDQTQTELKQFLAYYGDVEIRPVGEAAAGLDAVFMRSPSLANYREHVLRDVAEDFCPVPQLEDMVHRRVGGEQGVRKIADLCRRATSAGYKPLMLIDEPQFGASDHMVEGEDGKVRRPCVLVQILDRIEQEAEMSRQEHWFVGLSATPFELNDLNRVWEVRQYLSSNYSGFNFFNQSPISEDVTITPPITMGLTAFGDEVDIPFMASISMSAYSGRAAAFARHARKIGYTGEHAEYQEEVEDALRGAILAVIEQHEGDEPIGLCIRAFNDNTRTRDLIERLDLDPNEVDIVEYFGDISEKGSVKRVISRRARPDLPFVIFVTNRARMADAFPVQVRFFMDLAQKAADLNALLQGLLGRACGYGKKSTVVLSDANSGIVDAYVATQGGYVHKTSRHSIPVGGFRRGAPTSMIKLRLEMDDPKMQEFFGRITAEVVDKEIPRGSLKLSPSRSRSEDGFRTAPILRIADEVGLFDHIERADVRMGLFPQIPTGFKVARSNATINHPRQPGVVLRYHLDGQGNCRYTFRWSERDAAAQGGAQGRARGKRDSSQHMEPTVYVEKFDPTTGEIIPKDDKRPGNWRAFMVTFPLMEPVRELESARVAYPKETCAYNDWMEPEEQAARDAEARRTKAA